MKSFRTDLSGQVYNIGPDDNEISIKQLATLVSQLSEIYLQFDHYPDRPREVKDAYCSSDKIRKEFNYNPTTEAKQTIKDMVDWIKPITREFEYHLPVELVTDQTPKTWTDKLI